MSPVPTPPPSEPAPSLRPVEELQALCDAATPGPWFAVESPFIEPGMVPFIVAGSPSPDGGRFVCDLDNMAGEAPRNPFADAAFIAAARTALPALLARLRAAEETLAAVGAWLAEAEPYPDRNGNKFASLRAILAEMPPLLIARSDSASLIEGLEKVRQRLCRYGPDASTCDCKYGASFKGEQSGCPELRRAIAVLAEGASR